MTGSREEVMLARILRNIGKFITESLKELNSEIFKESSMFEGLEQILGYQDDSDGNANDGEGFDIYSATTSWELLNQNLLVV